MANGKHKLKTENALGIEKKILLGEGGREIKLRRKADQISRSTLAISYERLAVSFLCGGIRSTRLKAYD